MNRPWLPALPQPPHDPLRIRLDAYAGFRSATAPGLCEGVTFAPDDDHALVLTALPGSGRLMTETSGAFGGLTWPRHVADLGRHGIVMLDARGRRLLRFDPCCCAFVPFSCVGDASRDPRMPETPAGIAFACGRLLVCDPAAHRVIVLHPETGAVSAVWRMTPDAALQPWAPVAAAVDSRGQIAIADVANGGIHVVDRRGRRRRYLEGVGAVRAIAFDRDDRLYLLRDGEATVRVIDFATGRVLEEVLRPETVASRFAVLPVHVFADGAIDVARLCGRDGDAQVVDPHGQALPSPHADAAPKFGTSGTWTSTALDSAIMGCVWDRVALCVAMPAQTRIAISVYTADTPPADDELASLPATHWSSIATWRSPAAPDDDDAVADASVDFMLRAPPGRYLWLRLVLTGTDEATPSISAIDIDFPRISLRRYLPSVFGEEPVAAEFIDRWLAVFDRGFRDIECQIDTQARLFDPMSAPTGDARGDFLRWLASWFGITLERSWPEDRTRRFLKMFPRLFPRRGTIGALRDTVYLFLGLDAWVDHAPARTRCVPCVTPTTPRWRPPRLMLEHFHLRRWLLLGQSRLSDNAKLWGERIVARSRLSDGHLGDREGAQLGVTRLDTSRDPHRDPFHIYAHRMSIFVPAACVRSPPLAAALARLVASERPAHVQADIIKVEPRFRVGVQAMLGLDAVIGKRAQPVTLDTATLGRATVLGGADGRDHTPRVGVARVGMQTIL